MRRFVDRVDCEQTTLFPECLGDWIDENNPVQVIDAFVDELDLAELSFDGVAPEATGRPSYHRSMLLKLYICGYLNRVQSSRRLEREAWRKVEVMWLPRRLVPDHRTIADFRKDNGEAIRKVCARFIMLCRRLNLFAEVSVVIDGSKFKAVKKRDRNSPGQRWSDAWRRSRRALPVICANSTAPIGGSRPWYARSRQPGSRAQFRFQGSPHAATWTMFGPS